MKILRTIIFSIIALSLLVYGCGEEPATFQEVEPEKNFEGTIVAVGDSLAEGLGVEEELAYPAVLEKKLHAWGIPIRLLMPASAVKLPAGPWPE